jgi:hypothetical protein
MLFGPIRRALTQGHELGRQIMAGDKMQRFAIPAVNDAIVGVADPHRIGQDGGEDGL